MVTIHENTKSYAINCINVFTFSFRSGVFVTKVYKYFNKVRACDRKFDLV